METNREVVTFNGLRYRRYPDSPNRSDRLYYTTRTRGRTIRLHVAIWEHENGPVPDGYHVHHRDGDTLNNDIGNLECLPGSEHHRHHAANLTPEQRAARTRHIDSIRHLTVAWHASPEGREWHRKHAQAVADAAKPRDAVCERCGKGYQSKLPKRFCSPNCRTRARCESGVDNETRECGWCNQPFEVNRYAKVRHCSRSCSARATKRKA